MDDLINQLTTVDVTECVNNPNAPYPFAKLYKSKNLNNTQEKRRKELLDAQKRKREKVIDSARGIPSKGYSSHRKIHYYKEYQDRIMFSEWLVDIPEDFTEKWVFLLCPKGQRTLIVANKGVTEAYNKNGAFKTQFFSKLPGGSLNTQHGGETILDCIWNFGCRQYYVLDVIKWGGIDLGECETEFRFFWLKSKFDENPELKELNSNKSGFQLLENYHCTYERLTEIMATPYQFPVNGTNNPKQPLVDGILFYHRECSYEPGFTPLVTWLKPYMLPDILSVPVHEEYLKERPPSYTSLEDFIEESKKQKHNWWTVKSVKNKENIQNSSMEH